MGGADARPSPALTLVFGQADATPCDAALAAAKQAAGKRGRRPPEVGRSLADILSGLPGQCLNRLVAAAKTATFSAQSTLFHEGEPATGCYWVRRGLLKACVLSADGEERLVTLYGPGDIVGELAMIDCMPRFATVSAVTDCQVAFVDAVTFKACLHDYPELHHYLAMTLARRVRDAQEDVAASFLPSTARVARALLKLVAHLGEPIDADHVGIPYPVRHDALAMVAGVARESASRVVASWRLREILSRTSKYPLVVHKANLQRE